MNIHVESLTSRFAEEQLKRLFFFFGDMRTTAIVKDVFTGVSGGFGYVQIEEGVARSASGQLNGFTLHNRTLVVKEAHEKKALKSPYKVGDSAFNAYRFKKN